MARLILSDTSPLIGLSRAGGIPWLRELFQRVEMTAPVRAELSAVGAVEPEIQKALDEGWLVSRSRTTLKARCPPHLGLGEWSTLEAARDHSGPCLVLLDDRLARREARALGLAVSGTAALVGMARTQGLIDSAREVFERLLQADFRLSPAVIRTVLERVEPSRP